MSERVSLGEATPWVVKIGSSLITDDGRGLNLTAISGWAEQIARLRESGKEIVLVSSGAVAEGMSRLGWKKRPRALYELQAAAAVGQMGLVQAYESQFKKHHMHSAQILLTHDDLKDRRRYLNARTTLRTLLKLGVIPVVNENDTVATDEIQFGDNDTLAALVANLVDARLLVILTDKAGLYDKNPDNTDDARLIECVNASETHLDKAAGPSGGQLGRGGMITKVTAARRAALSGTATLIAPGREPNILLKLARGDNLGSLLLPGKQPLAARKQWIANQLVSRGVLMLDEGAARVIRASGRSLLAIGVTAAEGDFKRGDMVICKDTAGLEIARGLINYSGDETRRILGQPSEKILETLGYVDEPELIHRDNLTTV